MSTRKRLRDEPGRRPARAVRAFARGAVAWAVCALAACGDGTSAFVPTPPPERPNVLLIVIDTLRADRCGFQGYERPTTPFLDSLAEESTVFRNCWAPASWTGPSHASLFTGLRPTNHGFEIGRRMYLGENHTTLAESLRAKGYRTGCFSANDYVAPSFGLAQGFDAYACTGVQPQFPYPFAETTNEMGLEFALSAHAEGQPFFLFLNHLEPHCPYDPPDDFEARFLRPCTPKERAEAGAVRFPLTLGYSAGVREVTRRQLDLASDLYDAEIAYVDYTLSKLFARLEEAGALEDTLVIITSDHGENLGDHHKLEHVFSMHRTLLHVPLLVRFPYLFEPGRLVDDVVRLEDVAATVLDVCRARPAVPLDGVPLLEPAGDRIARGSYGVPQPAVDLVQHNFGPADVSRLMVSTRSVYDGRYHFIRTSDGRETLYDVSTDPRETRDVAREWPQVTERLRRLADP